MRYACICISYFTHWSDKYLTESNLSEEVTENRILYKGQGTSERSEKLNLVTWT